jgi:hypothetical protein
MNKNFELRRRLKSAAHPLNFRPDAFWLRVKQRRQRQVLKKWHEESSRIGDSQSESGCACAFLILRVQAAF